MRIVFDWIPYRVDAGAVAKKAGVDPNDEDLYPLLLELAGRADEVVRPKAALRRVGVRHAGGKVLALGDIPFSSPVLDRNLADVEYVFAYVATCGRELDAIDVAGDPLVEYWLDMIRMMAVGAAHQYVADNVRERCGMRKIAKMNPGSLPMWPISEQAKLFELIGDVEQDIGVSLTDSFLMRPLKSVSGLIYETGREYENCMLCRRTDCMNRRAPYDERMAGEYGECVCGEKA